MDICNNKYILTTGSIFLVLYSSYVIPELPPVLQKFLKTPLMMLTCLSLFAYFFTNDIRASIIISLVFLIMINGIEGLTLENLPNCRFTCVKEKCSTSEVKSEVTSEV